MARCESVVVLSGKVSRDVEILVMESSDSESETDETSISNLNTNEEKDCNYDIPKNVDNEKLQISIGHVVSLQHLHDDADEEEGEKDDNTDKALLENSVDDKEDSDIIPIKIVAVTGSSDGGLRSKDSHPQSSIPARNNWEGAYNFKIKIKCSNLPTKSESTIFSKTHQKLYVGRGHPFNVLVYAENVPKGSIIRVTAVFAMIEDSYQVVTRCPTHEQADFAKGNPAYEHFIQCCSDTAVYTKHPTGDLSVYVPYEKPQEGEKFTSYLFKLTCFNSCSGGINRRPFMLVFALEKDNVPLGRQIIEAKVCACPLRDFKVDQCKVDGKKPKTDNANKSSAGDETVKGKYTISVKDPELYFFLQQMKCLYEMNAYSSKIQQDT